MSDDKRDDKRDPRRDEDATSTGFGPEPPTVPSDPRRQVDQVIGNYRIVRRIGEGGMGVVFEAQQQQPRREVALKVIRGGAFVDEAQVRMFQREAQSLARLKHPGIAAIYESGRTDDGQHFFAMELVRGETLREHVRRHDSKGPSAPAEIDRRLRLFLEICDAVSYAHQRGVIHRDLKPSNILVVPRGSQSSIHTAQPAIKILDFGLARITDPDVGMTVVSELGKVRGTLPYMSPEQVRGNPDHIDLRTDVYSLGVILYEMLTAERPLEVDPAAFHEGARIICEEPPRPLSKAWSGTRRPDRDAETIVMKSLEKDPERRYQSAAALADDIERYLKDQPILARPPSAGYQLRKMVARHKLGFAFASSVLLLIVAFGVTMAFQASRIAKERDRANRQAETAQQVSRFLVDIFEMPDPSVSKGNTVTAREVLDRGAERIHMELSDQPEVRAGLMETIGEVYSNLGLYDEASELIGEAHTLRSELVGADAPELVRVVLLEAQLADHRGDYGESERLSREALAAQRGRLDADDEHVAGSLQFLAVALKNQGRLQEAEQAYREALTLRRRILGDRNVLTASTLTSLAELLRLKGGKGDIDQAEGLHREALGISREIHGDLHPTVITCINNLALVLKDREDLDGAESLLRESLDLSRRLYGPDHPDITHAMNNLAALLLDRDRDEAMQLHREALQIRRKYFGENHPEVAASLNNLAVLLQRQGELDEAEQLMQEALEIVRTLLGDDHPHVGVSLYNLGRLRFRRTDFGGALEPLSEALPIVEKSSPPGHWRPGNLRVMIGDCLAHTGRFEEAEPLMLEGLRVIRADRGPEDPRTTAAAERIAAMYDRWNRPADAARYRE